MATIPVNPMRDRAKQAGASNHWGMPDGPGGPINDVAGGFDLTATGGSGMATWWASDFVHSHLYLSRDAYLSPPQDTLLPEEGTVFGGFGLDTDYVDPGDLRRTLLSMQIISGTGQHKELALVYSQEGDDVYLYFRYPKGSGHSTYYARVSKGYSYYFNRLYVALSWTATETTLHLLVPGLRPVKHTVNVGGARYFSGFGGGPLPTALSTSPPSDTWAQYRNFDFYMGDPCTFDRAVSHEEIGEWARLMEHGQSSEGMLPPLNNSRSELPSAIGPADTILTLGADAWKFAVPGETEQARVTLVDAADPSVYEVCALIANDLNQIELVRGQEGTTARAWPAGTLVRGFLTRSLLTQRSTWLPLNLGSMPDGGYGIPWWAVAGSQDVDESLEHLRLDVGNLSTLTDQLTAGMEYLGNQLTSMAARVTELESRPDQADYDALLSELNALKVRVAALEGAGGSDEFVLVDAQGNILTDASGAELTSGGLLASALVDGSGDALVDGEGVQLIAA